MNNMVCHFDEFSEKGAFDVGTHWKVKHDCDTLTGASLHSRVSTEMSEVLVFMDEMMKRLQRPVKDLDDVRSHMASLSDLRESEIR